MLIETGQRLLHYRLIEMIGEGGMGVVWKAEDTKLHRHVALKVLPQAMATGRGHFSMGLATLKLAPPSAPDGLPTAVGEPEYVVPAEGSWHVHNGGWSPDSQHIVYTHDQDYGDIYELIEEREYRSD